MRERKGERQRDRKREIKRERERESVVGFGFCESIWQHWGVPTAPVFDHI